MFWSCFTVFKPSKGCFGAYPSLPEQQQPSSHHPPVSLTATLLTAPPPVQEASMDGQAVLKQGAPSWKFGGFFRKRDPSHKARTVDDGVEIMKGDQYVWGIKMNGIPPR